MSRTTRKHPPVQMRLADCHGAMVEVPTNRADNHWGDQRKMRAKTKVAIRRRDRKKRGKPGDDDSTLDISPSRTHHTSIK